MCNVVYVYPHWILHGDCEKVWWGYQSGNQRGKLKKEKNYKKDPKKKQPNKRTNKIKSKQSKHTKHTQWKIMDYVYDRHNLAVVLCDIYIP